jgi:hypothetical protein
MFQHTEIWHFNEKCYFLGYKRTIKLIKPVNNTKFPPPKCFILYTCQALWFLLGRKVYMTKKYYPIFIYGCHCFRYWKVTEWIFSLCLLFLIKLLKINLTFFTFLNPGCILQILVSQNVVLLRKWFVLVINLFYWQVNQEDIATNHQTGHGSRCGPFLCDS